jgi:HD-GYP domain-containing protein (c-di-GMP phosphodiesterase class II)
MQTGSSQQGVGDLLIRLLQGNLRPRRPETLALDSVVGQRAVQVFDAAIGALAGSDAAIDLLLASEMRPSFLGPSVETALMVAIVGARRGWNDQRLLEATTSGLLADVGMLHLGEVALNKPGALNPEEQGVVRLHPERGAELLEPLTASFGSQIAQVALQHHERIDGAGYPNGLSGGAILEEAQIVGICHLYIAATRFRPYREALSPAKTIALIEGLAGSAWDPRVVRAFVDGVAPYPVGTLVRLSSGECGCVVRGGEALRPMIEVRWAADGSETAHRMVPASTSATGLRIVAVGE